MLCCRKAFCTRSREEHHRPRSGATAQIKIVGMGDDEHVVYNEDLSKNNTGELRTAKVTPRSGFIYKTAGENYPVRILKLYFTKLPQKCTAFYCRPNTSDAKVWYCNLPVGVNKLPTSYAQYCTPGRMGFNQTVEWPFVEGSAITALYYEGYGYTVKKVCGHRSVPKKNKD